MIDATPTPAPGSNEAVMLGCQCPRMDNAYGKGYMIDSEGQPLYVISQRCPLHGDGPEDEFVPGPVE